jgi:hypothetical protein
MLDPEPAVVGRDRGTEVRGRRRGRATRGRARTLTRATTACSGGPCTLHRPDVSFLTASSSSSSTPTAFHLTPKAWIQTLKKHIAQSSCILHCCYNYSGCYNSFLFAWHLYFGNVSGFFWDSYFVLWRISTGCVYIPRNSVAGALLQKLRFGRNLFGK